MKHWPSWLLIGIAASGCAPANRVTLPSWDIPPASIEAERPLPLPALPELGVAGDNATLDRDGVLMLKAYRTAAEANTTIADANAAALEAQAGAYNSLIEAGKLMAQIAEIREEMLELERRDAFIDRMTYRAIIIAGLAFAL